MKKEDCEARTLIALVVGVGFGVLIGSALLASFYPIFQSKEWAAWVQALGSVGAIVVAVFIGRESMRSAERLQLDRDLAERKRIETGYREVIRTLSAQTVAVISTVETAESVDSLRTNWYRYAEESINASLRAINSIPLYDLGNSERILFATILEMDARWVIRRVLEILREKGNAPLLATTKSVDLKRIRGSVTDAMNSFNATYK